MGHVYCLTRASTELQDQSPAAQEDRLRRECKCRGLTNPTVVHEPLGTSGLTTTFASRPMGRWLLRNLQDGDTLVVTALDRLGRSQSDTWPTVEKLCKRGVTIIALDFMDGQPLEIKNPVGRFIIQMMIAQCELEARMIGQRTKEAMAHRRRNCLPCNGALPWGRKRVPMPGFLTKKGHQAFRYEWDEQQLHYIAEIARRTLVEDYSMQSMIDQFRVQGRLDQRGKPFGVRGTRDSTNNAFREARNWFLKAGMAGELPPEWNEVVGLIIQNRKAPSAIPETLRRAWAARRAQAAARRNPEGGVEDRSTWTAEDWAAWWAVEQSKKEVSA